MLFLQGLVLQAPLERHWTQAPFRQARPLPQPVPSDLFVSWHDSWPLLHWKVPSLQGLLPQVPLERHWMHWPLTQAWFWAQPSWPFGPQQLPEGMHFPAHGLVVPEHIHWHWPVEASHLPT